MSYSNQPLDDATGRVGSGTSDNPSTDEISIRDIIDVLIRGRWIVAITLLAVLIPVGIYTAMLPNEYRASSIVLLHVDASSNLSNVLPGFSATANTNPWRMGNRALTNELFVLRQSLFLSERVAGRLMALGTTPSGAPLTVLEEPEQGVLTQQFVALRLLNSYITFSDQAADYDGIFMNAESTNPEEASLIANIYAEEYLQRTREASRSSVVASREFLQGQVDSLRGEVGEREEAVRGFMTREGAVRLDEEASFIVSRLASLQAERDNALIEAQMRQSTANSLRSEIQRIEPLLAQRFASGYEVRIQELRQTLGERQASLERIYLRNPELRTSASPPSEVAGLRREIESLEAQIRNLSDRLFQEAIAVGGVDAAGEGLRQAAQLRRQLIEEEITLSGLQAQASVIGQRIGGYEADLSRIPTQSIELARLTRDRQSSERLLQALGERLQETTVAEQSDLGFAELIRPALTPRDPVRPRRALNMMLGMLLGMMAGVALAFVRIGMDHRLHRPDDLRKHGYPVLGVVPNMDDLVKEEFNGADTVTIDGRDLDTRLVTLLSPLSTASESYRALRTAVQFSRPDVVVQTILVTSAEPADGKSTTAINLAVTMAQAGRKVLLVDADLRKPASHKKLGMERRPGLVEALFNESDSKNKALKTHSTAIDNLELLPAGTSAPNPSELLGSKSMRDFIVRLRDQYDIVIFDTPPVLAATDAVLLSTQCDATILVAAAGETKDFEFDMARESLLGVGAKIIGVVLNRFDLTKAYGYRYRYVSAYKDKYGYGYVAKEDQPA